MPRGLEVRLVVRMSGEMRRQLDEAARAQDRSTAALARLVLRDWLAQHTAQHTAQQPGPPDPTGGIGGEGAG